MSSPARPRLLAGALCGALVLAAVARLLLAPPPELTWLAAPPPHGDEPCCALSAGAPPWQLTPGWARLAGLLLGLATPLLLLGAALSAGLPLLRLVQAPREEAPAPGAEGLERGLLALGLGLGALIFAAYLLGALGLYHPLAVWALLAVALAPRLPRARAWLARPVGRHAGWPGPLTARTALLVGAGALYLLPALLAVLAPAVAWDDMVYHLRLPALYAAAGGLQRLPLFFYSDMGTHLHLLGVLALLLGGDVAVRALAALLGLCAAAAVFALARRLGGPRAGRYAAVLFLATPVVLATLPTAAVGLPVTLLTSLAALALLRYAGQRSAGAAALAGIFCGLAAGAKYTAAFPALAVGLALLALSARRGERGRRPGHPLLFGLAALAALAPHLLKDLLLTGNPVYPMLYGLFGGEGWEPQMGDELQRWLGAMGPGRSALDLLLGPLRLAFTAGPGYERFDASNAPFTLVLLFFLPALRPLDRQARLLLALLGVQYALWFASVQQLRFFLPGLALAAALGGAVLQRVLGQAPRAAGALLGIAALLGQLLAPTDLCRLRCNLQAALGQQGTERYLREHLQPYPMIAFINRQTPARARLWFALENRCYYLQREAIADEVYEVSRTAYLMHRLGSAARFVAHLRGLGVTHVVINHQKLDRDFDRINEQRFPGFLRVLHALLREQLVPVHAAAGLVLYRLPLPADPPPARGPRRHTPG